MSEKAQIIVSGAVHLLMTVICILMMRDDGKIVFWLGCGVFGICWFVLRLVNRKRWIPWSAALLFAIGTGAELLLMHLNVIPEERAGFFRPWARDAYTVLLTAGTFILLLFNFLRWLFFRMKEKE